MRINYNASASHLCSFLPSCSAPPLRMGCESSCKIKVQHRGQLLSSPERTAARPMVPGVI